MPSPNTVIKLTSLFYTLNINKLNIQPKCKFLLRSMNDVKKNKKGYFKYNTLLKFMLKNKDNKLYYHGNGITSIANLYNYWNYAHSHKTAFIPNFCEMYDIIPVKLKKYNLKKSTNRNLNIQIKLVIN